MVLFIVLLIVVLKVLLIVVFNSVLRGSRLCTSSFGFLKKNSPFCFVLFFILFFYLALWEKQTGLLQYDRIASILLNTTKKMKKKKNGGVSETRALFDRYPSPLVAGDDFSEVTKKRPTLGSVIM